MKLTVLCLILTGFLSIPWLSHSSAQPRENSPTITTSPPTTSASQREGKSRICHFVNDPDSPQTFSVVIEVNNHSLDAHFTNHGDCLTEAPKGSKNCTCEPAPLITSFGSTDCCGFSGNLSWTSTGGTTAVLEHLDSVANGGGLIQSFSVNPNGSLGGVVAAPCDHQFRLVITGPGGTVSQTILNNSRAGDGSCFT